MKRRMINVLVIGCGLLSGLFLVSWAASYCEGGFALFSNGSSGYGFVTAQRGTIAFCLVAATQHLPNGQYFWLLDSDEMFDNQAASPEKIVKLPDSGALRLAIGPQYYPWRWQLNGAIEAFAPLWLIAVFLGIVPAAWAFGAFDAKQSPPAEISPTEKKLP